MTPEAHERRRIRMPVLAVTAVAWAVILLADPLRSASGSGAGSAPGSLYGRLAPACGAYHAAVDAGLPASHASTGNVAELLIGWALMLTAMMTPLLIPALRHVRARSLRSRRWRAVSLVMVAHAAVWTVGGIVLLAVASLLRSVTGQPGLAVLLGLDAALAWQLSPLKQHCLNRHCAHPPRRTPFRRHARRVVPRVVLGADARVPARAGVARGRHAGRLRVDVGRAARPPGTPDLAGTPPTAFPAHRRRDGPIPAPACSYPCRRVHGPGWAGRARRAWRWRQSVRTVMTTLPTLWGTVLRAVEILRDEGLVLIVPAAAPTSA
jgi:predicted metal-binding membrane protein